MARAPKCKAVSRAAAGSFLVDLIVVVWPGGRATKPEDSWRGQVRQLEIGRRGGVGLV